MNFPLYWSISVLIVSLAGSEALAKHLVISNQRLIISCFRPKIPIEETVTVATDIPVSRAPDLEDGPPASPPRFIHTMQKAEVIEGSAARFDVTLTGSPEPEVQWLKDDKPLKENRKFRFEQDDDGVFSLFVNDVEADDENSHEDSANVSTESTPREVRSIYLCRKARHTMSLS